MNFKSRNRITRNTIFVSALGVTIVTLLIKISGLIKQSVLAAYCGANIETDAFFIATGILVSLCSAIFSAISVSLLTMHTDALINYGRKRSNELINASLRFFLPIAVGISILFFGGAPIIAVIFAPAYGKEELTILAGYIRIMSIAFIFWCYFLIINVILETDKKFIPGKGQGLFQNIFLIFGTIFLYPKYGIKVLIYAFLLSGVAESILVTWSARKQFSLIFNRIDTQGKIRELVVLAIPLMLGNAIYEINDIVDKRISTEIGVGSVSVLTYGGTVNEIVTGVIVSSVSTVMFAHFVTWISQGDVVKVNDNLNKTLEYLTVIVLPVMILCIVAGDQIVKLLYGRGNFGEKEIRLTYGVVVGYAVGFVFQVARANLVKLYYAFKDTRIPMINGTIAVGVNIVLSILLSRYIGPAGIALATSIAMCLVTVLLLRGVRKYLPSFSLKSNLKECGKAIFASVLTAVFLLSIRCYIKYNPLICLVIYGVITIILYTGILYAIKARLIRIGIKYVKNMIRTIGDKA